MTSRLICLTLVVLTGAAGAACGGAARGRATAAAPATARPARPLDRHAIALQLGNGFRDRLARLAVMEQPREGATDLGQDLPAGLLRDVRCRPAGAPAAGRRRWACDVRWETPAGRPRATRYAVTALPTGCFGAAATPRLPDHFDPTINTYAEHPLNTIISVRKGC
jgi:hypothetical protein